MIIACQNISKSFGINEVLKNINFSVEERDKCALIGVNGAGKSTLLKIITGEISADTGNVYISKGRSIGYLAQYQEINGDRSIYEEVLSSRAEILITEQKLRQMELDMKNAEGEDLDQLLSDYTNLMHSFEQSDGYAYKSEVVGVLKGLGFSEDEFGRMLSSLSGGQKTRVALGRLLLRKPDILLLDEPTNHLDISSINWLETYLLNYQGTVMIVSHDRYFLDRIVNKVIEIENGKSMIFPGNYTVYHEKKAIIRRSEYNAYLKQQAEIAHQEQVIEKLRSFNREKSIKRAESREKALEKIQIVEKPAELNAEMRIRFQPRTTSGEDVLHVDHLSMSFPGNELFSDQSFSIKRGERVAVIGDNGTGKTTLLKILNGILFPVSGNFSLGTKVKIGYYDQEQQVLHDHKTIFEEISDDYPDMNQTEIRNLLAAFLFTNDDVFQPISSLSGGERGRVSLAKLMLSEANFLILDEPTNHLDLVSKEVLEEALNHYTGTVLYVSHDRYFVNCTATRILDLNNHTFVNYIGNYDYYMEKKDILTAAYAFGSSVSESFPSEQISESKADWQNKKALQAEARKKENELKKVEKQIAELEKHSKEIDEAFLLPETGTNVARCQELAKEQAEINNELETLYEKWEVLAE